MNFHRASYALVVPLAVSLSSAALADPRPYDPVIHAEDFVSQVNNPYFPLPSGRHWTYRSTDGTERIEVEVLPGSKPILGVSTTIVHDEVFTNGTKTEDTFDWYAQHEDGTVWYFGEDTKTLDAQGNTISTEGSWEAGVAGAKPGIVMLAHPEAGDSYRQEFFAGFAEDFAKVVRLGEVVSVPWGVFGNCVETTEWTPLAPGPKEHKFYASGIGLVLEVDRKERLELTNVQP